MCSNTARIEPTSPNASSWTRKVQVPLAFTPTSAASGWSGRQVPVNGASATVAFWICLVASPTVPRVSVLIVTGTGTGVGKTVVTAAVAALAADRGARVAAVKPAQTGLEIGRLSGVADLHEMARYPDPLSPEAAARRSALPALALDQLAREVVALAADRDLVLVEGAGGLLVRFSDDGWTLADLARLISADVLVVTAAGLGTLNATALTLEVMAGRGLRLAGLVIGSWPVEPDLASRCNVGDLERLAGRPLAGALPEGAPARPDFLGAARHGLGPPLGGSFAAASFRHEATPP